MAVTNYTNAPEATDAPKTPTSAKMTLEKLKHSSKSAFDKGWAAFEKLGVPVNKLTNKIGSEAFWPTDLGQESDKAARILKSFCSMLPALLVPLRLANDNRGWFLQGATRSRSDKFFGTARSPGPQE